MSENEFVVEVSENEVRCRQPDGTMESISWDDLQSVEILTTDQGPFFFDVFWVLNGSDVGCLIPQGATGEKKLLDHLQALPGFRNEVMIEAMCSTENCRFLCWERDDSRKKPEG